MARLIALLWLLTALAMPVVDDGDDDDDDDDDCWMTDAPPTHHDTPTAVIFVPSTPHPSPSQNPHATLPVSHHSDTPVVVGTVFSIAIALAAIVFTARFVRRRRRRHPPWRCKRLSDESWVSPALDEQRRLTTTTPTDAEFDVPPVRVPSPVYISPFSPSPSVSSSPSSVSPAPSTDPLPSPARLSRLLSSTFTNTRFVDSPTRPTTAHLIQTARAYAHAYRPASTCTSLYTPPTPSVRLAGTRARTSFYPDERARDTVSTVTTTDTISDPVDDHPVGTPLGLKLRLSDASEHARYRLRERERERSRGVDEFKLRDSESVLREIGW